MQLNGIKTQLNGDDMQLNEDVTKQACSVMQMNNCDLYSVKF